MSSKKNAALIRLLKCLLYNYILRYFPLSFLLALLFPYFQENRYGFSPSCMVLWSE